MSKNFLKKRISFRVENKLTKRLKKVTSIFFLFLDTLTISVSLLISLCESYNFFVLFSTS